MECWWNGVECWRNALVEWDDAVVTVDRARATIDAEWAALQASDFDGDDRALLVQALQQRTQADEAVQSLRTALESWTLPEGVGSAPRAGSGATTNDGVKSTG